MKMTIEEKLKAVILIRYNSIREFVLDIDMPYSTLNSLFLRGINNSSVSTVIKVCKALGISADALADGRIEYVKSKDITDTVEIKEVLNHTKEILETSGFVTIDREKATPTEVEYFIEKIDELIEDC